MVLIRLMLRLWVRVSRLVVLWLLGMVKLEGYFIFWLWLNLMVFRFSGEMVRLVLFSGWCRLWRVFLIM